MAEFFEALGTLEEEGTVQLLRFCFILKICHTSRKRPTAMASLIVT